MWVSGLSRDISFKTTAVEIGAIYLLNKNKLYEILSIEIRKQIELVFYNQLILIHFMCNYKGIYLYYFYLMFKIVLLSK